MADANRNSTTRAQRAPYEVLEFEKPILELENKIAELETLSRGTELSLNGEIQPLKDLLQRRVREIFRGLTPWQEIQVARTQGRPLTTDYVDGMCDEFVELHGDRFFGDDGAMITGLGRIGPRRVIIIGQRKGRDMKERLRFNFGSAHPEGYRKALRKMRLGEKYGLPIVTLINTPGAYPGIGAEERGQAWAIAENLQAMFQLRVPVVSVVIGEGGSGGALGIGIADRVLMLQHAYYSVITPEGCAAILWNDAKRAHEAAVALKLTSSSLVDLGVVDEVVEEPSGAAHRDPQATIRLVRERILAHLDELTAMPVDALLDARYRKFRAMGTSFGTVSAPEPAPAADAAPASEES